MQPCASIVSREHTRKAEPSSVLLIVESKPNNIAISAFPTSAIGGKMIAMNEGVELLYGRPIAVN